MDECEGMKSCDNNSCCDSELFTEGVTVTKVLVTGANSQLGRCIKDSYELLREGKSCEEKLRSEFVFATREELDITDYNGVVSYIQKNGIDCIINCAAYTNVDKANIERNKAYLCNSIGPQVLGLVARELGIYLIHISTDYVFDGEKVGEYNNYDMPNPKSVYGLTKLYGEKYLCDIENLEYVTEDDHMNPHRETGFGILIIRTQWLYSEYGKNFFTTIWDKLKEKLAMRSRKISECPTNPDKEVLTIVNDQFGCPTYAGSLADFILDYTINGIKDRNTIRIVHYSDNGKCSWYDFASFIESHFMQVFGTYNESLIKPISTDYYKTHINKASVDRPKSVVFSHESLECIGFRPCFIGYEPNNWMVNAGRCINRFLKTVDTKQDIS